MVPAASPVVNQHAKQKHFTPGFLGETAVYLYGKRPALGPGEDHTGTIR